MVVLGRESRAVLHSADFRKHVACVVEREFLFICAVGVVGDSVRRVVGRSRSRNQPEFLAVPCLTAGRAFRTSAVRFIPQAVLLRRCYNP